MHGKNKYETRVLTESIAILVIIIHWAKLIGSSAFPRGDISRFLHFFRV